MTRQQINTTFRTANSELQVALAIRAESAVQQLGKIGHIRALTIEMARLACLLPTDLYREVAVPQPVPDLWPEGLVTDVSPDQTPP